MNPEEIKAKLDEYNRHVGKLVRLTSSFDRQRIANGGQVHSSQVFIAGEFKYTKIHLEFSVVQENAPSNVWHFNAGSWELEVFGHGTLT